MYWHMNAVINAIRVVMIWTDDFCCTEPCDIHIVFPILVVTNRVLNANWRATIKSISGWTTPFLKHDCVFCCKWDNTKVIVVVWYLMTFYLVIRYDSCSFLSISSFSNLVFTTMLRFVYFEVQRNLPPQCVRRTTCHMIKIWIRTHTVHNSEKLQNLMYLEKNKMVNKALPTYISNVKFY